MLLSIRQLQRHNKGVSYYKLEVSVVDCRRGTADFINIFTFRPDIPLGGWQFSSNKGKLVCELIDCHSDYKRMFFAEDGICIDADVNNDEVLDLINTISLIERKFTWKVLADMSWVVHDLDEFRKKLSPYILELMFEDKVEENNATA